MLFQVQQLQAAVRFVDDVVQNKALSWEDKYSQVFSEHGSARIRTLFKALNVRFEWCDPDADYKDDVRAYYGALKSRMSELEPLWAAFAHIQSQELTEQLVDGLGKAVGMAEELMAGGATADRLQELVSQNLAPAKAAMASARQRVGEE